MNTLPNGSKPIESVIRVTAKDLTSKDVTPLTSQSGISEVALSSLKNLKNAPGLHVALADKTVIFELSDVQKAAFLNSFEKDRFDAFSLKPTNPVIAEKISFLLEMYRSSVIADLLNANVIENDEYEPIQNYEGIEAEIQKHGGSLTDYLAHLKSNSHYTDVVENILHDILGKFENLNLSAEDLKRLSAFLKTSRGQALFQAVQRQMTPDIVNKYFQESILSPIRQKMVKVVDAGKVKAAEKRTELVDTTYMPSKEVRVMPLFSEIEDIGVKTRLISINRNLRDHEHYNEDPSKATEDDFGHLYTAVEDFLLLPSSTRKGIGKLLYEQGISEKTLKDFCSRVLNPDSYFSEIGVPKPNKPLKFWEELSYDSDALLSDYSIAKNKEFPFEEQLPANMSEAAKATGLKVVEATSTFRAFFNRILRWLGFAVDEPRITLKHKGIQLKLDPKVVAESAFKHHFAKTPLLRNTDGTIKVAISDEFVAKKMDSSGISQTVISRKRDTLRDMLHDLIQIKTAMALTIDKAAHDIAEWQFKKRPVHPITREPLTMAQLELIARQEIEAVMPDIEEIENQYLKGTDPSIIKEEIINAVISKVGKRYPWPLSLILPEDLGSDPTKHMMFKQVDIEATLKEFLNVGDSFNIPWSSALGDSAKVYNKKFQEVLSQELEKYDDLVPGSKEYNVLIKFVTDNPKYIKFEKGSGFVRSGERVMRGEGVQEFIAKRVDAFVNGTIKVKFAEESEDMVHAGLLSIMTGEVALDKDNVVKWPGTPEFEALKKRDLKANTMRIEAKKKQKPKISEELRTLIQGLTIKGEQLDISNGVEIGAFVGPKKLITSKIIGKEYRDLSLTEFQNRFMGPRGEYSKRLQDFIDRGIYGTSPTGFTEVEDVRQKADNFSQKLLDEVISRKKRSPEELVELRKEAKFLSKYADDCIAYLETQVASASADELKLIQRQMKALKVQSNLLKETDGKWVASINQLHKHFGDNEFANSYMKEFEQSSTKEMENETLFTGFVLDQLGRSSTKAADAARMKAIVEGRSTRGFYDFNLTRDLEKYLNKKLTELDPVKQPEQIAQTTQERDKLRKVISEREFAKAFASSMKGVVSFQEALPIWRKRVENTWTYLCSEKQPDGHGWVELSIPKKIQTVQSLIKEYSTKEKLEARDPATEDVRNMISFIPQIIQDDVTSEMRMAIPKDYDKEELKLNLIDNPVARLGQIDEIVTSLENPQISLKTPEAIERHLENAIAYYGLVNRGVGKENIDQDELNTLALRLEHIILSTASLAKAKAPEFAVEKRKANEARDFADIVENSFTQDIPIWKQTIGNTWRYQTSKASPGSGWNHMDTMDAIVQLSNLAREYVTPEKVEENNPVVEAITDAADAISKVVKNSRGKFSVIDPQLISKLPENQKPQFNDNVLPHELLGEVEESVDALESFDIQTMEDASNVMKRALACFIFLKNPDADADNSDVERLSDRLEILMNAISIKLPFLKAREGQFDKERQNLNASDESPQILFDRTSNTLVTTTKQKAQGTKLVEIGAEASQILQRAQVINKHIQNAKAEQQAKEMKHVRNAVSQLSSAINQNLPIWKQYKEGTWIYKGGHTAPEGWQPMPLVDVLATLANLSKKYATTEMLSAQDPIAKAIQEVIEAVAHVIKTKTSGVGFISKAQLDKMTSTEKSNFDKNVKPSEILLYINDKISELEIAPIQTIKDAENVMTQALAYFAFLQTPDKVVIQNDVQDYLNRLDILMKSVNRVVPIIQGHANEAQRSKQVIESTELALANEFRELARSEDTPHIYYDPSHENVVMTSQRNAKAKKFTKVTDELILRAHTVHVMSMSNITEVLVINRAKALAYFAELIEGINDTLNTPRQKIEELFAHLQMVSDILKLRLELQFSPEAVGMLRIKSDELKQEIKQSLERNETLTQELANQIKSSAPIDQILRIFISLPQKNRIALGAILAKSDVPKLALKAFNDAVLKIRRDHPEILNNAIIETNLVEKELRQKQLIIELESARALIATAVATEEMAKENVPASENTTQLQKRIGEVNAKIDQANTPAQLRVVLAHLPEVSKIAESQTAKVHLEKEQLDKELSLIESVNKELATSQLAIKSTHPTESAQILKAIDVLKEQHEEIRSAIDNGVIEMKEILKGEVRKSILRTDLEMRRTASEGLARKIVLTQLSEAANVSKDALNANLQIRDQIISGAADTATEKLFIETIQPWFEEYNIDLGTFDGMLSELSNNPKKLEEHPEFLQRLDDHIRRVGQETPVAYLSADQRQELAAERFTTRRNDPIISSQDTLKNVLHAWKADPNALELRFVTRTEEISPVSRDQAKKTSEPIDLQKYRTFTVQKSYNIYSKNNKTLGVDESNFRVNQAAYGFVKAQLAKPQSPENESFLRSEELRLGKVIMQTPATLLANMQPMLIPGAITGSAIAEAHRTPQQDLGLLSQQLHSLKTKMFEVIYAPLPNTRDELYAQYKLGNELLKLIDDLEKNNMSFRRLTEAEKRAVQTRMAELKTAIFNMMTESESIVEEITATLKSYPNTPLIGAVQAFVELPKDSRKALALNLIQNSVSVGAIKDFAHAIRAIKRDSPLLQNSAHITATSPQEREIQINKLFAELEFAGADLVRTAAESEEQQTQVQKLVEKINRNIDQAKTPEAIHEMISQYPEVVKLLNRESPNVEREILQLKQENDSIVKVVEDLAKMHMEKPQESILNEIKLLKVQAKVIANSIDNVITELKDMLKAEVRRSIMRRNEVIRKDIRQGLAKDLALMTTATAADVNPKELNDNLAILRFVQSGKANKEMAQKYAMETDKWFKDHKIDTANVDRIFNGLMDNPLKIDSHPEFTKRLEEFISKSIGQGGPVFKTEERSRLAAEREKIRFQQLQSTPHAAIDKFNSKIDQAKTSQEVFDIMRFFPQAHYKMEQHKATFNKEMQQLLLEGDLHTKTIESLAKKFMDIRGTSEAQQLEKQIDSIRNQMSIDDIIHDMDNAVLELKATAKEAVRQAIMSTRIDARRVEPDKFVDSEKRSERANAREKLRIANPEFNRQYTLNKIFNNWETDPTSLKARLVDNQVAFVGLDQIPRIGNPAPITLEQFRKYRNNPPIEVMVHSSTYKYQKEVMGRDITQMGINAALYGFVRSELGKRQSEADLKYLKAQEQLLAELVLNPNTQMEVPKPVKPPVGKGTVAEAPKKAGEKDLGLQQKLSRLSFGESYSQVNSVLNELLSMNATVPREIDEKAKPPHVPPSSPKALSIPALPMPTQPKATFRSEEISAKVAEPPQIDPKIAIYEQILKRVQFISSTIKSSPKLPLAQIYENNERLAEILEATKEKHESINSTRTQIHALIADAQNKLDSLTLSHFEKKSSSDLVKDISEASKTSYYPDKVDAFMNVYKALSLVSYTLFNRLRTQSNLRLKDDEFKNLKTSLEAIEENRAALEAILPTTESARTDLNNASTLLNEIETIIKNAIKANSAFL